MNMCASPNVCCQYLKVPESTRVMKKYHITRKRQCPNDTISYYYIMTILPEMSYLLLTRGLVQAMLTHYRWSHSLADGACWNFVSNAGFDAHSALISTNWPRQGVGWTPAISFTTFLVGLSEYNTDFVVASRLQIPIPIRINVFFSYIGTTDVVTLWVRISKSSKFRHLKVT